MAKRPERPIETPGRGAWRQSGGLLPLKPTGAVAPQRVGYYRRNAATEVRIGAAGAGPDSTYGQRCVWYGVQALQDFLGVRPDGRFGGEAEDATLAFQKAHPATGKPDGIVGPATALALFTPVITAAAEEYGVSVATLGGILRWESGLDPAAVGVNGLDTGMAQVNLGVHDVTMEQACDPTWAVTFTAAELSRVIKVWRHRTGVDLETIAIANHNNPVLARTWALTGKAPFSQARADQGFPQINEYVAHVRAAGRVFT